MIPSTKTLSTLTSEFAKDLRKVLEQPGSVHNALEESNRLLGGCGVEYIPKGKNSKSPAIYYVNMGDPYIITLLYVSGNYRVGCWGDIVERGNYD